MTVAPDTLGSEMPPEWCFMQSQSQACPVYECISELVLESVLQVFGVVSLVHLGKQYLVDGCLRGRRHRVDVAATRARGGGSWWKGALTLFFVLPLFLAVFVFKINQYTDWAKAYNGRLQ